MHRHVPLRKIVSLGYKRHRLICDHNMEVVTAVYTWLYCVTVHLTAPTPTKDCSTRVSK